MWQFWMGLILLLQEDGSGMMGCGIDKEERFIHAFEATASEETEIEIVKYEQLR